MIQFTLAEAAKILGIHSNHLNDEFHDLSFHGLSIDTRTLQAKQLFIALPGNHVDGHHFLQDAKIKGAAAALVGPQPLPADVNAVPPCLLVDDPAKAMGLLSSAWREKFSLPLVAVTGSNGKTTLKNMIASIMQSAQPNHLDAVLATIGTLNNHLGLPLTLSKLNKTHQFAVLEMGMNHFGEIEYLCKLAKPTVAVITNAAACHLQGVGSIEGVARAKAEILLNLSQHGTAILNRDDAFFDFWCAQLNGQKLLSFGFHPNADVGTSPNSNKIHTPKGTLEINLPLLGQHNIANALAATAAALSIDIDLAAIKMGLENNQAAEGRLKLHELRNGVRLIDDTYNANPFSLQAAINTLVTFNGKKVLVLGDMKELGENEKQLHYSAGENIRQAGIDYLFTYGELSANAAIAFGEGAYHFNEQHKLIEALKPLLSYTSTILVKGSRSMHMENVIKHLVEANALML